MNKTRPLIIALMSLLGGCAAQGSFAPAPEPVTPPSYRNAPAEVPNTLQANWWRIYQDPVLNHLVETVQERNPYTEVALLRVAEAQAGVQATSADLLPNVGFGASADKSHTSVNTPLGKLLGGRTIAGKTYKLGVSASWQLDLWGRVAQAVEAAKAQAGAAEAVKRQIALVLASEVAVAYWQFRAADADHALLTKIRDERAEAVRLGSLRLEAGLGTEQDWLDAKVELAKVEAEMSEVRVKRAMAEQELATLMVEPVKDFRVPSDPAYRLPAIPQVAPGLPAVILARRPDLMESTQNIRALLAVERIAETAFYPSISLTGAYGFASSQLKSAVNHSSREFSIGPLALYLPLFDAGRNQANLDAARSRYRQAVDVHQVSVLIALREVDDALVQVEAANEQMRTLGLSLAASQRASAVAKARFEYGQNTYQKVASARASALAVERSLVRSQSEGLLATVRLVAALGGGWEGVEVKDGAKPAKDVVARSE